MDRFAAEGKNFICRWGSPFFHSKRYPNALFYKDRNGNYMSHDEIHQPIRYAHGKGIKFCMAVGGFAWLTMDTLAQLYAETRAIGSSGSRRETSRPKTGARRRSDSSSCRRLARTANVPGGRPSRSAASSSSCTSTSE